MTTRNEAVVAGSNVFRIPHPLVLYVTEGDVVLPVPIPASFTADTAEEAARQLLEAARKARAGSKSAPSTVRD